MIERLPKARRDRIAARAQAIKEEIKGAKSRAESQLRPRT